MSGAAVAFEARLPRSRAATGLAVSLACGALAAAVQATVVAAWRRLTSAERADGAIVAGNYGEASALELYGPARGLPPVLSGHLSWQYWRPRSLPQRFVLFVGFDPSNLPRLCATWRPLATIDNRYHLANEERGRLIAACTLRRPLGTIWNTDIATNSL